MNSRGDAIEGRERYWLNDDTWIEQRGSDANGWQIVASDGRILDNRGAAFLAAGGEKWAGWPPPRGNFGELPPESQVWDIGFDGTVIWTPLRNSGGNGEPPRQLAIWGSDARWTIPARTARAASGGHFVCALYDGRIWSNTLGYAVIPAKVMPFSAVYVNGWVLYYTDAYLVLQHFDRAEGVVVATAPTYSPDLVRLSDGTLKVAWSSNPSEMNVHTMLFAPNFATQDLSGLSDTAQPSPPASSDGAISLPTIERPIWQAPFFSHSHQYGSTPLEQHVGNCAWVRTSEMDVAPPMAHITTVDDGNVAAANLNLTVAWWVSGATIGNLLNAVNVALEYPEKPVIAYLDSIDWPEANPFSSMRVWPSIQAYPRVNESVEAFRVRLEGGVVRVAGYGLPLVLTSRFDDTAGTIPVETLLGYMPIYESLLRNYYFVAHMPFSDRRGNAISSNKALWQWARGFQNAISLGKPNRFDYWRPAGTSIPEILKNKLGQSRAAVVLEPYLREAILEAFPVEDPPPEPEPEPPPSTEWPNLLPTIEHVRAKYPAMIDWDQSVAIVNEVAWIHRADGFGCLRKDSGNHGQQPHTGTNCSVDWLVSNTFNLGKDCLGSTPNSDEGTLGAANPQWGEGEEFDLARWIAPVTP